MVTMMSKPITKYKLVPEFRKEYHQMSDKRKTQQQKIHQGTLFTSVLYRPYFCSNPGFLLTLLLMIMHFITITT